jgi:hypothetical protein
MRVTPTVLGSKIILADLIKAVSSMLCHLVENNHQVHLDRFTFLFVESGNELP